MKLLLRKNYLRGISKFSSKDDVRYYLNGVALEVKGESVILVATNGHVLGALRLFPPQEIIDPVDGSYILPGDLIKQIKKPRRQDSQFVLVDVPDPKEPGSVVRLSYDSVVLEGKLIDAKYPEWHKVVPAKVDGNVAQFDPKYLNAFVDYAVELGSSHLVPVVSHNGNGPALVEVEANSAFIGVLMPVRLGGGCSAAPQWAYGNEEAPIKKRALKAVA